MAATGMSLMRRPFLSDVPSAGAGSNFQPYRCAAASVAGWDDALATGACVDVPAGTAKTGGAQSGGAQSRRWPLAGIPARTGHGCMAS